LSADGSTVCLGLRSNASYPIGADLAVTAGHDQDLRTLDISWKVSIIPILMEYDREANLALDLDFPDKERLGRFVDERILRFVSDYLRIHEPGSPYLRLAQVRDPVCGMTFPASEAASSLMIGHETYYFCAEQCAAAFEAERARYSGRPT
jgi:YHS domain-containing protein